MTMCKTFSYHKILRIIQHTVYIVLIISNIILTTIKYFTNLKYPTSLSKPAPKPFRNLRTCVNSNPIKLILTNKPLNPSDKLILYKLILLFKIR